MRKPPKRVTAMVIGGVAMLGAAAVGVTLATAPGVGPAHKALTAAATSVGGTAAFGTPTVDGTDDATWANAAPLQITGSSPITATAKFMWDAKYLYILADVSDDTDCTTPTAAGQWQGHGQLGTFEDGVDAWINWTDSGSASYAGATGSLISVGRDGLTGTTFANSPGNELTGTKTAVTSTASGYTVTMAIPWPDGVVRPGSPVGIVVSANDSADCNDTRTSYITSDNVDAYWNTPDGIPTLQMQGGDNGQVFETTSFAVTQGKTAYLPVWSDLADGGVTYSTSNGSVARVDPATGQVTGKRPGTAVITAKTAAGLTSQLTVSVAAAAPTPSYRAVSITGLPGTLASPSGVALDTSGDLWVSDAVRDDVVEFSPQGKALRAFGKPGSGDGELDEPEAIAVHGGDVYVLDAGNSRVEEFTSAGQFVRVIGGPGSGAGQFAQAPTGLAVDAKGDVWVTANAYDQVTEASSEQVDEFGPTGTFLTSVTPTNDPGGPDGAAPGSLGFDASGDLWVGEDGSSGSSGAYVGEYDASGNQTAEIGDRSGLNDRGFLYDVGGFAFDAKGDIFVADSAADVVQVYNLANGGEWVGALGLPGGANSLSSGVTLDAPSGVAVNAAGDVFVSDREDHRVVEFVPQGKK